MGFTEKVPVTTAKSEPYGCGAVGRGGAGKDSEQMLEWQSMPGVRGSRRTESKERILDDQRAG